MKQRYLSRRQAAEYTGLSINTVVKAAKKAHAIFKIGTRTLIDSRKLDDYFERKALEGRD